MKMRKNNYQYKIFSGDTDVSIEDYVYTVSEEVADMMEEIRTPEFSRLADKEEYIRYIRGVELNKVDNDLIGVIFYDLDKKTIMELINIAEWAVRNGETVEEARSRFYRR